MSHSVFFRWVRGLIPAFLITLLLVFTGVVVLVISAGFPSPVLRFLEKELADQGIYMKVDKVRLELFDGLGLVARDMAFYEQDPGQSIEPLLRVTRARLDFSVDSIWSGRPSLKDLKKLELKGVYLSLPLVQETGEDIDRLELENLSGDIILQAQGIVDFSHFAWRLEGVDFEADGRCRFTFPEDVMPGEEAGFVCLPIVTGTGSSGENELEALMDTVRENSENIRRWLKVIRKTELSTEPRPLVRLSFDGSADHWHASRIAVTILAPYIEYDGYRMRDLDIEASLQHGIISVEKLFFRDTVGVFHGEGSYMAKNSQLHGRINSSILWEPVRSTFIDSRPLPYGIKLNYPVGMEAEMNMTLDPETFQVKDYQVTGEISSRNVEGAGVSIRRMSADFSVSPGNFYLDNLMINFGDSSLVGRVLRKDDLLNLDLMSDVPLEMFLAFAHETGSEIDLPEDLEISGIPKFQTNLKIRFPENEKNAPEVQGKFSLECESLVYRDYKIQGLFLKTEFANLVLPGYENISEATQGFLELSCTGFSHSMVSMDNLEAKLTFDKLDFPREGPPFSMNNGNLQASGHNFLYKGIMFREVQTELFYKDGEGFLPKLIAITDSGREVIATAKLQNKILTAKAKSTLLLNEIYALYQDEIVKMHNDRVVFGRDGRMEAEADLMINVDGWDKYKITGSAQAQDATYNGVPLESAFSNFAYIPDELTLSDVKLVFLYAHYGMIAKTKVSPAPSKGTFTAKTLVNDEKKSTVEIKGLEGKGYPEPLIRMFAPRTADEISHFVFYEAPNVRANGIIDIVDERMRNTNLKVNFTAPRVDYDLAGRLLKMSQVSSEVHIDNKEMVHLNNFKGRIWEGNFYGQIGVSVSASKELYKGSLTFMDCNLKRVGRTYNVDFEDAKANAYLNFEMPGSTLRSLKGQGRVELTDGDLLKVPFFGPLTIVFEKVIGFIPGVGDLFGSRINKASCNFNIVDGIMYTRDFYATGSNISIEGTAKVDLQEEKLNMDIRANLKSLIGLITLPLGLSGIFTFHGEGPLEKPLWDWVPMSGAHKGQ